MADIDYITNSIESLELIQKTHFLDYIKVYQGNQTEPYYIIHCTWRTRRTTPEQMFTSEVVKWTINSVKTFKSWVGDGIVPILLQKGVDHILYYVVEFSKDQYRTNVYVPHCWKKVRVVFKPKAANKPFDEAKSYRPIYLAPFLLKPLGKIIDCVISRHYQCL